MRKREIRMAYTKVEPCRFCPFTNGAPAGWLGAERAQEFADNCLTGPQAFPCHETVDYDHEGEVFPDADPDENNGTWITQPTPPVHCAGARQMMHATQGGPNLSERLAIMSGWPVSPTVTSAKVFASVSEFITWHAASNSEEQS